MFTNRHVDKSLNQSTLLPQFMIDCACHEPVDPSLFDDFQMTRINSELMRNSTATIMNMHDRAVALLYS